MMARQSSLRPALHVLSEQLFGLPPLWNQVGLCGGWVISAGRLFGSNVSGKEGHWRWPYVRIPADDRDRAEIGWSAYWV